MPKFNDDTLEQINIKGGNFGYSAVRIENLAATEYTLIVIACDSSGSVANYKDELEKCIAEVVKSCKYSPKADNLMIRLIQFNNNVSEIHGFKLLQNCNPDDYKNCLNVGGMTALFDASYDSISAMNDYAKSLTENDFNVNGIVFVITDGVDNMSTYSPDKVKEALKKAVSGEVMESLVSVLIGVDAESGTKQYLDDYHKNAGFTQYISMGEANQKKLAKLAEFVSKSISSQSQSLGTGGPSKALPLTF